MEVLKESDIINVSIPLTEETTNLISKEKIELLKHNATFINTGRGAQVDEVGMLKVLKEREDLCALLDVTVEEPPKADSDFFKLSNVYLTPHIAGSMSNEVKRSFEEFGIMK